MTKVSLQQQNQLCCYNRKSLFHGDGACLYWWTSGQCHWDLNATRRATLGKQIWREQSYKNYPKNPHKTLESLEPGLEVVITWSIQPYYRQRSRLTLTDSMVLQGWRRFGQRCWRHYIWLGSCGKHASLMLMAIWGSAFGLPNQDGGLYFFKKLRRRYVPIIEEWHTLTLSHRKGLCQGSGEETASYNWT